MTFWYLATPYTKYPLGTDAAFSLACANAALLMQAGVHVFSPIAHSHPIAVHGRLPLDHSFPWLRFDEPFVRAARGMIQLRAEGWAESHGMEVERRLFAEAGKPVVIMEPGIVPPGAFQ